MIHQELQKVTTILQKKLNFKDIKFPVKVREIHKIEKKNSIVISVFGNGNKETYPICVSKKSCEEKRVELLLIGKEVKKHFLSKNLIHLWMIIHYIVEENIFVFIVYKLLAQKKYSNFVLKITLKLMLNKGFRCLKR